MLRTRCTMYAIKGRYVVGRLRECGGRFGVRRNGLLVANRFRRDLHVVGMK